MYEGWPLLNLSKPCGRGSVWIDHTQGEEKESGVLPGDLHVKVEVLRTESLALAFKSKQDLPEPFFVMAAARNECVCNVQCLNCEFCASVYLCLSRWHRQVSWGGSQPQGPLRSLLPWPVGDSVR